jgi:hypothetical protein
MKSFFRENPTIAFGLGLPLLLVMLFLIISGIPSLLVAPAQYDVLYATGNYNYQNTAQILVVDQKVQVNNQINNQGLQRPRLWRFKPTTGAVKEITIIWAPTPANTENDRAADENAQQNTVIDVAELAGVTGDSSSIAPDGYEFSTSTDRYSRNVFGGLFYSSRYNNEAVLKKSGRRIRLPSTSNQSYYRNIQFVGWVVVE